MRDDESRIGSRCEGPWSKDHLIWAGTGNAWNGVFAPHSDGGELIERQDYEVHDSFRLDIMKQSEVALPVLTPTDLTTSQGLPQVNRIFEMTDDHLFFRTRNMNTPSGNPRWH